MIAEPLFVLTSFTTFTACVWFFQKQRRLQAWPALLLGLLYFADSWIRSMQIEPASLRPESMIALIGTMLIVGVFPLALMQATHQSIKNRTSLVFLSLPLLVSVMLLALPDTTAHTARTAGVISAVVLVSSRIWHLSKSTSPCVAIRRQDALVVFVLLFTPASLLRIIWPDVIGTNYSDDLNAAIAVLDLMSLVLVFTLSAQEWPIHLASFVRSLRLIAPVAGAPDAGYYQDGKRLGVKTLNRIAEFLGAPVALILPGETVVSEKPHHAAALAQVPRITVAKRAIPLSRCYIPGPDNYKHDVHQNRYLAIQLWDPPIDTESTWLLIGAEVYARFNTYQKSCELLVLMQEMRDIALQDVVLPRLKLVEQQSRIGRMMARVTTLRRQEAELAGVSHEVVKSVDEGNKMEKPGGLLAQYLEQFERRLIELSLQTSHGVVNAAATLLGVDKVRIGRLMRRYHINRENYRSRRQRNPEHKQD